ncbi:MAG TPA: hypothetical protein V6C81_25575 [Planktothrix sp.]|jgi:hypothetical protein
MAQTRFDMSAQFGGDDAPAPAAAAASAEKTTGNNLLADSQQSSAQVATASAEQPSTLTPPDQAPAGTTPEMVKIQATLRHAAQVRAHVVMPGQVLTITDLNFNRQPAWNPHAIQKGPVDTIDDIILDKQGNLSINANKKATTTTPEGTINIGIIADQMHWSPLFLPQAQQDTIRTTVDYLRTNNPQLRVPAPLSDVPWTCLAAPQQQGPDAIDPAMFQKLLDKNKLTDRIVAAVAGNEGNLETVVTDDAGYGWSIGMRQWNQHVGELPTLLSAMYKKDPCTFVKDFGPYASKIINNAGDPSQATVNEPFIRHADFSALLGFTDARHKHVEHVKDLQKALSDFQDVQVALSRKWVNGGVRLAQKYGFTSELGWAEVCDIVNQKGAGGTEKTIKLIPSASDATEADRIQALENAAKRPGGQTRLSNLEKLFSAETTAVS